MAKKQEIQKQTFFMMWLLCLVLIVLSAFIIFQNQSLKSELVKVKSPVTQVYTCPKDGWVDCMPTVGKAKNDCSQAAISWYKANCPNFKGGAY